MKNILISINVLFIFYILHNGDAAITGWTEPTISGADGTGTLTISENQATSDTITTFVATTDVTSDSSITYSLDSAVSPFAVAATGELTITEALDFETKTSYTLNIKAVDNASPTAGSGTATITVTITDVNEAPVFSATYSPCILDGSATDTTLTTVQATDTDATSSLSYAITGGNTGNAFKIDTTSGLIQVAEAITLDKNTLAAYDLVVTATNNGSPAKTGTATVSATVKDVCDNGSSGVTFSALLLLFAFIITKA